MRRTKRAARGAWRAVVLVTAAAVVPLANTQGQSAPDPIDGLRIELSPPSLDLEVGSTAEVEAVVVDGSQNVVETRTLVFISSAQRSLSVGLDGRIEAVNPGRFTVTVSATVGDEIVTRLLPVYVPEPALANVAINSPGPSLYAGTNLMLSAEVTDTRGTVRDEVAVRWESSDQGVARVDDLGLLTAIRPGSFVVTASAEGVSGNTAFEVVPNPVVALRVERDDGDVRTGDVVHLRTVATDESGRVVDGIAVQYAVIPPQEVAFQSTEAAAYFRPDSIHTAISKRQARAEVDASGRFVAEDPGRYIVLAIGPGHTAQMAVDVAPRDVGRRLEFVGQGQVSDVMTSDLWVWEGVDGRDYAATGTHSANGTTYFWDVTDPTAPTMTDSITVDARTVNDVKVSEDGRVAVISREGASTRRNGIVILDVSNPRDVRIISEFDDRLTGGVHNHFIYDDHVYVVNNIRRMDVISIEDPTNPHRVAVFELDTPGHLLHDVWVVDGIAFVSYIFDGVVLLDIGNGVAGGSPQAPVQFGQYKYPVAVKGDVAQSVPTHAAFPYWSPTGKFYVFIGDEVFRELETGAPTETTGYIHVVDFTDLENPEEVARYEVPEAGTHNFWIEGDTLYAGFFEGGLRVVDISGELKGDLYAQGREMASFTPLDPGGYVANNAFIWGAQPHKGNIFMADAHSGLWAVKLMPARRPVIP